jgi:oligopeptide transport system ATP-binding protein
MPDPDIEKNKKLIVYDPGMHDYRTQKAEWIELYPGHFVQANRKEAEEYRRLYS